MALGEWGCEFSEERFYARGGFPAAKVITLLNQEQGLKMPVADVGQRKEALYYELLPQLKAVPEVVEHIDAQYGQIPFAVVSVSTKESVVASLRTIGLLEKFAALVCAEDTKRANQTRKDF